MPKINENPCAKMRTMLPALRRKTKLLKYNWFLRNFWSLSNRLCAAPSESSHQGRGANLKNSGQESRFQNRALAGEKGVTNMNQPKSIRPVTKNCFGWPDPKLQKHAAQQGYISKIIAALVGYYGFCNIQHPGSLLAVKPGRRQKGLTRYYSI